MSAPAFTPGPWRVATDDLAVFDGEGEYLATVALHGDLPEAEANARLIAAAPALYAALEAVLEESEFQIEFEVWEAGRIALAAARGEVTP